MNPVPRRSQTFISLARIGHRSLFSSGLKINLGSRYLTNDKWLHTFTLTLPGHDHAAGVVPMDRLVTSLCRVPGEPVKEGVVVHQAHEVPEECPGALAHLKVGRQRVGRDHLEHDLLGRHGLGEKGFF